MREYRVETPWITKNEKIQDKPSAGKMVGTVFYKSKGQY